jgi:beta-ribofuranosylaminobenzene 5'-phosphate synthase
MIPIIFGSSRSNPAKRIERILKKDIKTILMLIDTPKRLHLGIIDPSGSLGRRFGSLGVGIEYGYLLRLEESDRPEIIAENDEDKKDIKDALERMDRRFETGFDYYIKVERRIERHIGLGSTTQLKLAVGFGIAKLKKIDAEIEEISKVLGRGKNSGASTYVFKHGGFVIDAGVRNGFPPLAFREEIPRDWAFLLIIPKLGRGLDEVEEKPIMSTVTSRSEIAEKISHRILLGLIPAIRERKIEDFGRFLSEIQILVGKHFENYQGGIFREDLEVLTDFLREKTFGFGQSSWGPTLYGLIYKKDYGNLKLQAEDWLKSYGISASVELGIPRNHGAKIFQQSESE